MNLFHVTPYRNADSIEEHGIDPAFALNKDRPFTWWCESARLHRAVEHIGKRYALSASELIIYVMHVDKPALQYFKLYQTGIWRLGRVVARNVDGLWFF